MKNAFLLILLLLWAGHQTHAQKPPVLPVLKGHKTGISHAQLSQNGAWAVSSSKDKLIKIWETKTARCIQTIRAFAKPLITLTISPNGQYVAASSHNKTVKVWQSSTGQVVFEKKMGYVTNLVFSPNSEYLLTSKNTGKLSPLGLLVGQASVKDIGVVKIWSLLSGKKLSRFKVARNVSAIAFSPDNRYIATGGSDKILKVWDVFSGRVAFTKYHDQNIPAIKYSPNGKYLAYFVNYQMAYLIDPLTSRLIKNIKFDKNIQELYYSVDGDYLIGRSSYGVQAYNIKTGQLLKQKDLYGGMKGIYIDKYGGLLVLNQHRPDQLGLKYQYGVFSVSPEMRMRQYVQTKINAWQKKGKFEKTKDYRQRVTTAARQKKIATYTQEAINLLAQKDVNWYTAKNEYDADNETFKIMVGSKYIFYVKVPIAEAKNFDENFSYIQYKNKKFTITPEGKYVLLHVELYSARDNKTYVYDNQQVSAFNSKQLAMKFDHIRIKVPKGNPIPKTNPTVKKTNADSSLPADIDQNLPHTAMQNPHAIAVVIGNRDYLKTKAVKYAVNDAQSIKNYLVGTLGFKEGNILYQENATKGDFEVLFGNQANHKGKLYNTVKAGKSDVFVFYSGHGAPDTKNFKGYFVPVECDPMYVSLAGYSIDLFYNNLAKLPAKSITVVLDACFSGADILKNISPIGIKSKGIKGIKNGTLLASSQGSQVSGWYNNKRHGLFTYFFLKAIHNKNADVNQDNQLTFKEIYRYLSNQTEGVPYWARRLHNVEQMPVLQGKNVERVLVKY